MVARANGGRSSAGCFTARDVRAVGDGPRSMEEARRLESLERAFAQERQVPARFVRRGSLFDRSRIARYAYLRHSQRCRPSGRRAGDAERRRA